MPAARKFSRYLWAAPATLIGLVAALIARAGGGSLRICDGMIEAEAPLLARLPAPLQVSAVTLGHVVIGADRDALAASRLHERVHVRQYERWGALFFPLYVGSSLFALLRGRNPYWDNHFEREAYRAERAGAMAARRAGTAAVASEEAHEQKQSDHRNAEREFGCGGEREADSRAPAGLRRGADVRSHG